MRKIKQNKTKQIYIRCNKSVGVDISVLKQQARKRETLRLFRRKKQKYLKKRWERKSHTNLKTDSYVNKKITFIYYKKRHKGEGRKICSEFLKECRKIKCGLFLYQKISFFVKKMSFYFPI